MGIITDVELRTGKAQLAKSLKVKGVATEEEKKLIAPIVAKKVMAKLKGASPAERRRLLEAMRAQ